MSSDVHFLPFLLKIFLSNSAFYKIGRNVFSIKPLINPVKVLFGYLL